jgi:hypothetical protein
LGAVIGALGASLTVDDGRCRTSSAIVAMLKIKIKE